MKYYDITKQLAETILEYKKHNLTEADKKQILKWTQELLNQ